MANLALVYRAVFSLQDIEFDRIVLFTTWSNCMRAVMTGFAVQASVFSRETIQRMILVVLSAVMAAVTAWLVQPRIGIIFHSGHPAVAINAGHSAL